MLNKKLKDLFSKEGFKIWYISVLVIAALIIIAILSNLISGKLLNSQKSNAVEESIADIKLYESYMLNDVSITVTKVDRLDRLKLLEGKSNYLYPSDGKIFVAVKLLIKNDSEDRIPYSPDDFKILNSRGQLSGRIPENIIYDNALNGGELLPKGSVSGYLIFEQPKDDMALKLEYSVNNGQLDLRVKFKLQ